MNEQTELSEKQLAVIDDLFAGELDEQAILKRHKIRRAVYYQWLADENFQAVLIRRIRSARLLSEVLIARYSVAAAAKLVQLTDCEKEETARKACLDIISLPAASQSQQDDDEQAQTEQLDDETARRLLAALAQEK